MSDKAFTLESVLADAREKSGLDDFGNTDFHEGLEVLLETYANNNFSEKGLRRLRRRAVDLVATRARIEKAFKDYPGIADEKITQPIYLTGLPRTGTSALLNLLANDSNNRPLKLWEGLMPDPCEGFEHGKEDPRYTMMKAWQEEQNKKDPEFSKIHHTTADTPEECIHLLNHTFTDVQFGMETMMEPYGSWFQKQDLSKSYDYYAKLLQMLQYQRPGNRWLLKSPAHLWALKHINQLFPDACMVITHRNPLQAVTSYASMMASLMKERDFDKKALGPIVMQYLARKVEAGLAQREHIDANRFLDIHFEDFVNDSIGTVKTIYQHFNLPLSEANEKAIVDYAKAHPMNKHGKHEYQLEEYGLTEAQVLERFDFYIKRFNIAV